MSIQKNSRKEKIRLSASMDKQNGVNTNYFAIVKKKLK
jgi:hypothetical protein